ncbi:hypothetical protein JCM6882_006326 [Rhodosporidiobolus microsporus]
MAAPPSSDGPSERKLTKAQKKALAFRDRAKGKGKAPKVVLNEEDAVPEEEDLAALEAAGGEAGAVKEGGKKRKRAAEDEGEGAEGGAEEGKEEKGGEAEDEQPKKKKRQRGKTPAQRAREAREKEGAEGAAAGASRLLLFVGNLPYKVTVEEIQKHFEPCGEKPTVRLLTPKSASASSTSAAPQSKGCAFLEFTLASALQSALRLHQSTLPGHPRKINVELTAGGGGNSAARKAKIEEQRKKLTGEREKAAKNKRIREGEGEDGDKTGRWKLAAAKQAAAASAEGAEGADGAAAAPTAGAEGDKPKKKVRDRRLKNATNAGASSSSAAAAPAAALGGGRKAKEMRLPKASSGANAIKLASGWGNKGK